MIPVSSDDEFEVDRLTVRTARVFRPNRSLRTTAVGVCVASAALVSVLAVAWHRPSPVAVAGRGTFTREVECANCHTDAWDVSTQQYGHCCKQEHAACLACKAGRSLAAYCSESETQDVTGCGACGLEEQYHVYPGGNIATCRADNSSDCCAKCRAEPRCTSWTLGQDKICHLKDQIEMKRVHNGWFVSGLPGRDRFLYEIKLRHGVCLAAQDAKARMQECNAAVAVNQQWSYDRKTGNVKTGSLCLEALATSVFLRTCRFGATQQRWDYTGIDGLIKHSGLCLAANGVSLQLVACDDKSPAQQWSMWHVSHLSDPATRYWMGMENWTVKTNSLWCFSLMIPWGVEPSLLRMQRAEHQSIFACDESAVYSNHELDLGADYKTTAVNVELHCPIGGRFHSALNTPVFIALWDQVFRDARYKLYDWTVKVDPDAVFIPWRLVDIVWRPEHNGAQKGRGMFFQNCQDALHGPVEILSRKAVDVFKSGHKTCPWHNQEDWYLSDCLMHLGVTPSRVGALLADQACDTFDASCEQPKAAFHPFKTPTQYRKCWASATMEGSWHNGKK